MIYLRFPASAGQLEVDTLFLLDCNSKSLFRRLWDGRGDGAGQGALRLYVSGSRWTLVSS